MSTSGLSGTSKIGDRISSGKTKFQPQNINSVFSGKSLVGSKTGGFAKHGLQALGKQSVVTRRMPPPANLPSLRSESAGQDPNVNLVPTNGPGWGVQDQPPTSSAPQAVSTSLNLQQSSSKVGNGNAGSAGPVVASGGASSATGGNSRDADLRPSWNRSQGEAGFYSTTSNRDFPSLAAAGEPRAAVVDQGGPSLRPQKHGSWKSGGKVGGDEGKEETGTERAEEENSPPQSPTPHPLPPPLPSAQQPRFNRNYYPAYAGPVGPRGYPPGPPPPPFYAVHQSGPSHPGGPPRFPHMPYQDRMGSTGYLGYQDRHHPHGPPPQHMDPRSRPDPREYGEMDHRGYDDYNVRKPSLSDEERRGPPRNGTEPHPYYGRPDPRGPDRDFRSYDSRVPYDHYDRPYNSQHYAQRGTVWSDEEEEMRRDPYSQGHRQPEPPTERHMDVRARNGRPRQSWEPEDNFEAGEDQQDWDYSKGERPMPRRLMPPYSERPAGPVQHMPMGKGEGPRMEAGNYFSQGSRGHPYPHRGPAYPTHSYPVSGEYGAPSGNGVSERRGLGSRDFRSIEAEEAEELRRQSQQAAEREAAIERSRQKRRLGQQASISSSGTGDTSEVQAPIPERSYGSVDEEDNEDRPNSRDSAGRNLARKRQPNAMSQGVPPRFQRQLAEQKNEFGGMKPPRDTDYRESENFSRKYFAPERNEPSFNNARNKPTIRRHEDRKGDTRNENDPYSGEAETQRSNRKTHQREEKKKKEESHAVPLLSAVVQEDDLRFTAAKTMSSALEVEDQEEEQEQTMQVLSKPGTKVVKRTVGEGDRKTERNQKSHEHRHEKRSHEQKAQKKAHDQKNGSGSIANKSKTQSNNKSTNEKTENEDESSPKVNIWEQRREKRESQEREAKMATVPQPVTHQNNSRPTREPPHMPPPIQFNSTPNEEQFRNLDDAFRVPEPEKTEENRLSDQDNLGGRFGGVSRGRNQREFISQSRRRGGSVTGFPVRGSTSARGRGNRRGNSSTGTGLNRRRHVSGEQLESQAPTEDAKGKDVEIGQWDNSTASGIDEKPAETPVGNGSEETPVEIDAMTSESNRGSSNQRGRFSSLGLRGNGAKPNQRRGNGNPSNFPNYFPTNPKFYFPFMDPGPNPFLVNGRGGMRGRGGGNYPPGPIGRGRRGTGPTRGRGGPRGTQGPGERNRPNNFPEASENASENDTPRTDNGRLRPQRGRRTQRRRSAGRTKEKDRPGASAKSPNQSEGQDEWETASESSDVAERREKRDNDENGRRPNSGNGGGPQRYSNQRRGDRGNRGKQANSANGNQTTWGPNSGPNREQRDGKTDSSIGGTTGQKNVKIASLQGHRNSNSRSGNSEASKEPLNTCKPDALAGVDLNDIAGVVVIDNHPDVTGSAFEWGDFQEVLSKKEKRLRREQQLLEEKKKDRSIRWASEKSGHNKDKNSLATGVTEISSWSPPEVEPKLAVSTPIEPANPIPPASFAGTMSSIGSGDLMAKQEVGIASPFERSNIIGWEVQPGSVSKTGVEIWGTPDPIPFGAVGREKSDKEQKTEQVERPGPPKSVEFPADMNVVASGEPDYDFTFDPNLPSTEEGEAFGANFGVECPQGSENGTEDRKLTEGLDRVKELWKSEAEGRRQGEESESAAIVNSAVTLAVLKQKQDDAKADGPQIAKVLPQQQMQPAFQEPQMVCHDYNYQNGNRELFQLESPVLKLQPLTYNPNAMFGNSGQGTISSASPPSFLNRSTQGNVDFSQPPPAPLMFNHQGGTLWSAQQPPPPFQNMFSSPGLDIFGSGPGRQPGNPLATGTSTTYFIGSNPGHGPRPQSQMHPGQKQPSASIAPAMFQSNPPTAFLLPETMNSSPAGIMGLASQPPPPMLAPIGSQRNVATGTLAGPGQMMPQQGGQPVHGQGNYFLTANPQQGFPTVSHSSGGGSILGPPPAQGPPMPPYNFQMSGSAGNMGFAPQQGQQQQPPPQQQPQHHAMNRFPKLGVTKSVSTSPVSHFNSAVGPTGPGVKMIESSQAMSMLGSPHLTAAPFRMPQHPPHQRRGNENGKMEVKSAQLIESEPQSHGSLDARKREGNLLQQIDNFINDGEPTHGEGSTENAEKAS